MVDGWVRFLYEKENPIVFLLMLLFLLSHIIVITIQITTHSHHRIPDAHIFMIITIIQLCISVQIYFGLLDFILKSGNPALVCCLPNTIHDTMPHVWILCLSLVEYTDHLEKCKIIQTILTEEFAPYLLTYSSINQFHSHPQSPTKIRNDK